MDVGDLISESSLITCYCSLPVWASQVALVAKNLPANAGDVKDMGSVPGSGGSPGGGNGNPPQFSCLENPMDRIPWGLAGYSS